jgi:predicted flavoprotein YhiN
MTKKEMKVAVVGGGPAGLMAAEVLSARGVEVHLYDAMPSVGRKFLLAGRGGLNLTHSEPLASFEGRFGERGAQIAPLLRAFGPDQLREWVHGLGIETFVGTSGRVFPADMKAAPLLRAWMHRLRAAGVRFHMRHRWLGWPDAASPSTALRFATPAGEIEAQGALAQRARRGGGAACAGQLRLRCRLVRAFRRTLCRPAVQVGRHRIHGLPRPPLCAQG